MAIGVNAPTQLSPLHDHNNDWVKLLATGRPRAYINARSERVGSGVAKRGRL
jgi:hypothetical protein